MWSRSPCAIRNGGAPADTQDSRLSSRARSGGVGDVRHTQQPGLEGERQQPGLHLGAGAGRGQVGLAEPVDHRLDGAGLAEMPADSALEPVDPGGQGQQRAQVGSCGGTPDADPLGGQAQARPVPP